MQAIGDIIVYLWSWDIVRIAAVLGGVLTAVPFIIVFERKVIGWVQERPGPNRVGPWGLLQGFADGIKLFFKETFRPAEIDTILYYMAPYFSIVPALVLLCILPFAPDGVGFLTAQSGQITIAANHDVGLLVYFAITSLGVYGLVLAGWSSNNKYSLLGGIRSSAQMVSYELSLALSVIGVLILAGSLNLQNIIHFQLARDAGPIYDINLWHWNIWAQPVAFMIFLIAGFAETNRLPFDLPEAESELTGGYHTEYSSMKFAMFFLAEYVHMIVISALISTLFLGGWSNPFGQGPTHLMLGPWSIGWLVDHLFFVLKVIGFLFFFIFIRATLPRLRYDQLMDWGWKWMLPLALGNLVVVAVVKSLIWVFFATPQAAGGYALPPEGKAALVLILLLINVAVVATYESKDLKKPKLSAQRRKGFRYVT